MPVRRSRDNGIYCHVCQFIYRLIQGRGANIYRLCYGIKLIGEQRFYGFARKATKYKLTRYTLAPVLSVIFLTSPMCFTFGRFVEEKYKPAFYDAQVSFVHPVTGLFPHANGGELFVYMGIAAGIQALGYPLGDLAVRYFLIGIVVIFLRGIITERIYIYMNRKAGRKV